MSKYYYLKKGEIIREGDEWLDDYNPPAVWKKDTCCVGEPAPDPQYTAHRQYRRMITGSEQEVGDK